MGTSIKGTLMNMNAADVNFFRPSGCRASVLLLRVLLLVCAALSGIWRSLSAEGPQMLSEQPFELRIEPLVQGKEGRRYRYKNLFRRGHDYYETFRIEGEEVRIEKRRVAEQMLPQLMPEFSHKQELMEDFRSYAANDFVELFFEMEDFPAQADTLYILNRLLQMESMTGIEYFSTREQKMTTYITSCSIVEKARRRKKLAPPQFESLPEEPVRLIIRQDDNRFAPAWYDVTIRLGADDSLRMTMQNITPVYVQFIFLFKALEAHKLRHEIVILPQGVPRVKAEDRKPVIYALSQVHNDRTQVLGIPLDLGNSFNRRMSSVQGWISQRIYDF